MRMSILHLGTGDLPKELRDPFYYIAMGLSWLCLVTAAVTGIGLLAGWIPGLR